MHSLQRDIQTAVCLVHAITWPTYTRMHGHTRKPKLTLETSFSRNLLASRARFACWLCRDFEQPFSSSRTAVAMKHLISAEKLFFIVFEIHWKSLGFCPSSSPIKKLVSQSTRRRLSPGGCKLLNAISHRRLTSVYGPELCLVIRRSESTKWRRVLA